MSVTKQTKTKNRSKTKTKRQKPSKAKPVEQAQPDRINFDTAVTEAKGPPFGNGVLREKGWRAS